MTAQQHEGPAERLARLYGLRDRVDAEIAALERTLRPRTEPKRRKASKFDPVECGTDRGYYRHRYLGKIGQEPWPLPPEDPCGCRAAHADVNRDRDRARAEKDRENGRGRRLRVVS